MSAQDSLLQVHKYPGLHRVSTQIWLMVTDPALNWLNELKAGLIPDEGLLQDTTTQGAQWGQQCHRRPHTTFQHRPHLPFLLTLELCSVGTSVS